MTRQQVIRVTKGFWGIHIKALSRKESSPMCLHIYTKKSEVPKNLKLILNNDRFFDSRTSLDTSELCTDILKTVDEAIYASPTSFIGREKHLSGLNKNCLSTGTKTLLNIISNPDLCFTVVECGQNALDFLPQIRDGHILWEMPVLAYAGEEDCDIEFKGKRYTNFYDLLNYTMGGDFDDD